MAIKIKLAGSISKLKVPIVNKCCKKLFSNSSITYFFYFRRYKDDRFTFLASSLDFPSYMFKDDKYPKTWFAGIPFDSLKSGYILWDIAKQLCPLDAQSIAEEVLSLFDLKYGIDILEKNHEYCDFYSFASNDPTMYFISISQLYEFIFYFKYECRELMLESYASPFQFYNLSKTISEIPIMDTRTLPVTAANSKFSPKRYYLGGELNQVFLTEREVEVLRKIEMGGTVKCIADDLCVSTRTFEHHIQNIKSKLNASRTTQIIHIAKENNIIL